MLKTVINLQSFWCAIFLISLSSAPLIKPIPLDIFVISVLFGTLLLSIAIIDEYWFIIPDSLIFTLVTFGFLFHIVWKTRQLAYHLIAAIAGFCFLWSVNKIYFFIRKQNGIGFGDFKLLAAIAIWVGPLGVISVLLIASLTGLAMAIVLIHSKHIAASPTVKLAFGAHMSFSGLIVWLFGPVEILP